MRFREVELRKLLSRGRGHNTTKCCVARYRNSIFTCFLASEEQTEAILAML